MQFENEHPLPGQIGQLSITICFFAALLAAISYFISTTQKDEAIANSWRRFARALFLTQAIGVVVIMGSLFYIIANHLFEYRYAFEHSSRALPYKYMLACFWEGQEGSFLLWMFWNSVLGTILLFTAKKWESPVMTVFSVVQIFLASMLLGIYIGNIHIGSTPFILMRNYMVDAPIFQRADYMQFIKDGNGLNPLLQNYWMVIHPPTLFCGFASTLVPFSFAIAALWKRNYTGWTQAVLPWALFSAAVLGTGVMMGGAWAYESLTFGGYWAWDPVENMSLVPWLMLIGGIHTLLAFNKTGYSLRSTFLFFILTFFLVLYSTFLTRSGILGNTSVHAFTDLGMSGQLLIYMGALSLPAFGLLIYHWKKIPHPQKEEQTYSREFWMFLGMIVFFISAIQIVIVTSLPVWNKLFGTNWAEPANKVQFYNQYQLPLAIFIAFLSSSSLFLKFKNTPDIKKFGRRILVSLILAALITAPLVFFQKINVVPDIALLFFSVYAVVTSLSYMILALKAKGRIHAPALAHFGFAVLLVGVLISSAKQRTISYNSLGIDFGKDFDAASQRDNMLLYKNIPQRMQNYIVTYVGDSVVKPNYYYKVKYQRIDSATGKISETFFLYPNAQINPKMGLIANPDTRHYLTHDIYTHVTSVPDPSQNMDVSEDKFKAHIIHRGDTIFATNSYAILKSIDRIDTSSRVQIGDGDLAVEATIDVYTLAGSYFVARPIYFIHNNEVQPITDEVKDLGLVFRMSKIIPDENKMEIDLAETKPQPDYIVLKAIIFPGINLVWLGTIITISGFLLSIFRIWQKKKRKVNVATT